ncbi:replication-relaxation family protein [Streptomyces sp. NPDC048255]|uniref:replication-relaxation family protein n=1 Tax=Streptomyces sp. NPDC048255 TaxID=3154713 RepID=UPI00340D5004
MQQALGIFQRATPEQLWKLTRPANKHDKLVRDTLLDLQEHRLVRVESKREDNRQVWVLTARGHREARSLLPREIRVSALRKEEYHPVTGKLLGTGYDDHALAVTATAAEMTRAGFGALLAWQTEVSHPLRGGYVQYADAVVKASAANVPVLLLEVDRLNEGVDDLVHKLRRYTEFFERLAPGADKEQPERAQRPDTIDQELRLWRNIYPRTGREGYPPIAFVFADGSEVTMDNTMRALEERGRAYWQGRRYQPHFRALNYHPVIPVVVTTLDRLQEHGADAAVWRRLGRDHWQTLTAALDNPNGARLYEKELTQARAQTAARAAAAREKRRPVCAGCGTKFTDERWEQTERRRDWGDDGTLCAACQEQKAETEIAAQIARIAPPEPAAWQEASPETPKGWLKGLGRRR